MLKKNRKESIHFFDCFAEWRFFGVRLAGFIVLHIIQLTGLHRTELDYAVTVHNPTLPYRYKTKLYFTIPLQNKTLLHDTIPLLHSREHNNTLPLHHITLLHFTIPLQNGT
jgi:hypothetical protein